MSEAENPSLLTPGHRVTVDEIRALTGPTTPHFALQVRNRIRRLIDPLAAEDPARIEGERKIAQLEEIARHSGELRGAANTETMGHEAGTRGHAA